MSDKISLRQEAQRAALNQQNSGDFKTIIRFLEQAYQSKLEQIPTIESSTETEQAKAYCLAAKKFLEVFNGNA